ncbi:UNVERIFIED_CONTAM: hypothetical protein FKN15_013850 [Acipenser sinensis]
MSLQVRRSAWAMLPVVFGCREKQKIGQLQIPNQQVGVSLQGATLYKGATD